MSSMTPWRVLMAMLAAAGLALAGCASTPAPDQETRQVLAPTGKLRVGVYLGSPTSMVRDAGTREPRGVTYELGRELAQRLGVPFEAVEFSPVSGVGDAMKDWRVDFTLTKPHPARAMLGGFTPPL